jgi:hypothetical protein
MAKMFVPAVKRVDGVKKVYAGQSVARRRLFCMERVRARHSFFHSKEVGDATERAKSRVDHRKTLSLDANWRQRHNGLEMQIAIVSTKVSVQRLPK